jgi:hypothetical protein
VRNGDFSTRGLLVALVFLALASPATKADLVYELLNGASLIYDSTSGVTWTQDGNLTSTQSPGNLGTYLNQADAMSWAAGLTTAGLTWTLPSASDFTSLYTQLDPVGPPGSTSDKYGTQVDFGPGPNDYASNVQMIYWTSATGTDFNFNYGYPGAADPDTAYYAWAVDETAPAPPTVPEPTSIVLVLSGIAGFALVRQARSRIIRARKAIA